MRRHVLVIKTRRARRKGGDIRQLLLPQHRAEPRGHWRSGDPGNVKVLCFPSLHFCPGVEGHTALLSAVLLDVVCHGFSSSAVPTDTVSAIASPGIPWWRAVTGQTVVLTGGAVLAARCRRATSASRPAIWGCFGSISRAC